MAKIFISYRREDSQHAVDRLHAGLKPHVADPDRDIFIDVDNIPLGVDFVVHLDSKVGECEILLAVIGTDWLSIKNPATGERRIDSPKDFVRIEIAAALKRGIPVVPVLLDGAPVPAEQDLPDDLKALATRHGTQISRMSFDGDVIRLARGLGLAQAPHEPSNVAETAAPVASVLQQPAPVQAAPVTSPDKKAKKSGRKWPLFAGLGVALVAVAGSAFVFLTNFDGNDQAWVEYGGIAFGDNSGSWARDGACDDDRFSGDGVASASHVMKDAADCLAAYQAGRITLLDDTAPAIVTAPVLTSPEELFSETLSRIDFGDDSSEYANDGDCDDARFYDQSTLASYRRAHVMHDATDCRAAVTNGQVGLLLDFGDDSGRFSRDGACDDHRFEGEGQSGFDIQDHAKQDATDCIAAYQASTISQIPG